MTTSINPDQIQQAAETAKLALEEEQKKGTATSTLANAAETAGDAVTDMTIDTVLDVAGSAVGAVVEGAGAVIGGAVEVAGSVVGGIISGILDS